MYEVENEKHPSLLRCKINYSRKKICDTGPRGLYYKNIMDS
jgi:hypothetical protein